MTKAIEIITSLSIGFKAACEAYRQMLDTYDDRAVKDMFGDRMIAAKNALMYYVAGYYKGSEEYFNWEASGGWNYCVEGYAYAVGYDRDVELS